MKNRSLLNKTIHAKFASLRRGLFARILQEGVCVFLIATVGLILISLAIDYLLRFETPVRTVLLIAFAATLIYALWKYVISPMRVKMSDEDLAILVESRNANLKDRLISALNFEKQTDFASAGMSESMVMKMAQQANELAQQIRFNDVIERKHARKLLLGAVGALLAISALTAALPSQMQMWFDRNVLLAEEDWPQQIYLNIFYLDKDDNVIAITRCNETGEYLEKIKRSIPVQQGDDLKLIVVSQGNEDPQSVQLTVDYPEVGADEEEFGPADSKDLAVIREKLAKFNLQNLDKRAIFIARIPSVISSVDFYIEGGDDKRDRRTPHKVKVIETPTIADVTFKIVPPKYFGDATVKSIKGASGTLSLALGSTILAKGSASKPLGKIFVRYAGKILPAENYKLLEDGNKFFAEISLTGKNIKKIRKEKIEFVLEDKLGYKSKRPEIFQVQIKPDKPPVFKTFERRIVSEFVSPDAQIPVFAKVTDDHGVKSIEVQYQIIKPAPKDKENTDSSKAEQAEQINYDVPWVTLSTKSDAELNRASTMEYLATLNIAPNPVTGKNALPEGTIIRFRAVAKDYLPHEIYKGPGVAVSDIIQVTVQSRLRMREIFNAKQGDIARQFDELYEQHKNATTLVEEAKPAGANAGPAEMLKISQAANLEKNALLAAINIAKKLEELIAEMQANQIKEEETSELLLNRIAKPLKTTIAAQLKLIGDHLEQLSKKVDPIRLDKAFIIQGEVTEMLREIRELMGDMKTRFSVAKTLEQILRLSRELEESIERENEKGFDDEFDE